MKRRHDAFSEAVKSGPFALIYWLTTLFAVVAVIVGVWGSVEQRVVTGAVVMVAVCLLIGVRYLVAARLRRRRERGTDIN